MLGEEIFPEEKFREHVLERLCVRLDKRLLVTRGEIARLLRRIKLPVPLFVTAAKIHVALDSTKFNQHQISGNIAQRVDFLPGSFLSQQGRQCLVD